MELTLAFWNLVLHLTTDYIITQEHLFVYIFQNICSPMLVFIYVHRYVSLKKFEDARYCMIFPKGNSSHHIERMGEFLQSVVKKSV